MHVGEKLEVEHPEHLAYAADIALTRIEAALFGFLKNLEDILQVEISAAPLVVERGAGCCLAALAQLSLHGLVVAGAEGLLCIGAYIPGVGASPAGESGAYHGIGHLEFGVDHGCRRIGLVLVDVVHRILGT
ncbi:hypothetical protein [uncultured Bacteroides sp.]|uniref:hypothetical protein n=1 Tax=uncultured Bacteroides sp. TaxID=162156 RepID=UPI00273170F9|nr:hypothetical protein [uncultured Bacteroides sp.]